MFFSCQTWNVTPQPWGRWWGTAGPRAERSCSCGASACDVVSSPVFCVKVFRSFDSLKCRNVEMCQKSKQDPSWAQTAAEEAEKALLFELFFCFEWTSDSFSLWLEEFAFCSPWKIFTEAGGDYRILQACAKFMEKTWKRQLLDQSCILFELYKKIHEACSLFRL